MPAAPDRQAVEVDGRRLVLSNLDRVMFPATGHTKAELVHYYAQVAPVILPHTADRAASFVRAPDGPDGQIWFAKRPPPGLPDWVSVTEIASRRKGSARHVVVDSAGALVAMANLGAWEVHVPQWTTSGGPDAHDRLVLDLDPGEGVDLVMCCRIAQRLRQMLDDDGLTAHPVTSGSKGLHLYVPLEPVPERTAAGYAKEVGVRLQAEHPGLALVSMARAERAGKVFVDWSQNASAKTTAAPYTLRVRQRPGVATPVTWDEVAACREPADLAFTPEEVMDRVQRHGDLFAPVAEPTGRGRLP